MVHIVDHHPDKQVLATGKSGGSFPCLYSNNSTENHLNSLRFDSLEFSSDAAFQLVFTSNTSDGREAVREFCDTRTLVCNPILKHLLFERAKELQRISSVPLRSELEAEKDDGRRTPTTTTSEERYRALPSGGDVCRPEKTPAL